MSATNFKPVAPTVLPAVFLRELPQANAEQRQTIKDVCEKLLSSVRSDLARNTGSPFPVNNVARSMTYALTQLLSGCDGRNRPAARSRRPAHQSARRSDSRSRWLPMKAFAKWATAKNRRPPK